MTVEVGAEDWVEAGAVDFSLVISVTLPSTTAFFPSLLDLLTCVMVSHRIDN